MKNIVFVHGISLQQIKSLKLKWRQERIDRINKAFVDGNEFFAAFDGPDAKTAACLAICAFEKQGDAWYLDEFAADGMKGAGFMTLQKAIETKYHKCWLLASPNYDEKNDTYVEATDLNEKYREQPYLEELKLKPSESPWNCNISLFYTSNLSSTVVKQLFIKKYGN